MRNETPEYREWSVAAVRLLQGVVEADDSRIWNILLANRSQLEQYFVRLGLRLVINDSEGFAYLKQFDSEEIPEGYENLPRLFRTSRLSHGQTLLCVLLRSAFRRFEEEETHDERCVVTETELFDQWKSFFPQQKDEPRQLKDLQLSLKKLEELGFVRSFGQVPPSWEVRRILKARITVEVLEQLRDQLQTAASRGQK